MAKLALITAKNYKPGINEIGDVVGIFPDNHPFTAKEMEFFDIVSVNGEKETLSLLIPQTKTIYKAASTEWSDTPPEMKNVWYSDGEWLEIVTSPKYKIRYQDSKIIENYSRAVENTTTVLMFDKAEIK